MLVDDIVSILDDHGFSDTSVTRKIEAINSAYHDLCSRYPWEFLRASSTVTTDATGKVTSPSDIRAVQSFHDGTYSGFLQWLRRDEFLGMFGYQTSMVDAPLYFFFRAGSVYVYPIKTASGWGILEYYKVEPDLASGGAENTILLPPRHHRKLADGALAYLYNMEDDPELAQIYERRFEEGIQKMYGDLMTQQYSRPETIKVLDDDF